MQRFLGLVDERQKAGLGFTEAMIAGYTAVLASPGFAFLDEKPGKLDDAALATRLALFLTHYGVRSLVHQIVQSDLFQQK